MSKVKTQLVIDGKNNTRKAFKEVDSELDGMTKKLATAGKALVAAFSVSAITGAIRGIATAADSYNLMNARLKLATGSQEEFNTAQAELGNIARRTQTPISSLVTLYGRISRPLKEVGRTQADILKVTEAVATSFRISGASAQEAENGVIQFAQALGAGALRGDEFNSVAEQAPRLMQALADSIGVPVGALKEMAAQGLLTASVVTDALVSSLDDLRAEAATLPQTVGGAMTALADDWNKAVGQADVQPLITAINELGKTLSDPAVMDNLIRLASALATLAGVTVGSASDFVDLGKTIARTVANSQGLVTELDNIDAEIGAIDKSLDASWSPGDFLTDIFFSEEELRAKRAALVALRATIVEQQTGMNAELQFLADVAADAAEFAREQEVKGYTTYLGDLKKLQDEQVKAAESASKKLVAAEKKATADLEKIRADRLKIEQRYKEAVAGLGGAGEASYGSAQALQLKAQQALASRDVAGAQANAQAALKMLQDLAAAGENTYGFEGFIQELQAIELAANDIEQTQAAEKIASIKAEIADLDAKAQALKDSPISFKMDDASLAAVRSQIEQLAAQLGAQLTIPVTVAHPDGPIIPAFPQFASGGRVRGPGTGTSDSILARLSNGEFVMRAAAVRAYGPALLEKMNGLQIPRFAEGGLVDSVSSMPGPTPGRDLGRVDLNVGGESFSLLAEGDQFDRILKNTARKFGRTRA